MRTKMTEYDGKGNTLWSLTTWEPKESLKRIAPTAVHPHEEMWSSEMTWMQCAGFIEMSELPGDYADFWQAGFTVEEIEAHKAR
jgi:hypothetical protein